MRALYLLGSGKPHGQSTSEALARYLHARLEAPGVEATAFEAIDAKKTLHADGEQRLLAAVDRTDLLVLATPLYIDSLPYPVIHALEAIAKHRWRGAAPCRLVAIVNSGFPEASQSELALRMCAVFAREAGLDWAGGLALGGGEAVHGQTLEKAGGAAAKARKAIELAAAALRENREIPERAVALMASPFIPTFLYRWLGSWGWRRRARSLGTATPLDDKPFVR
jgi:hypothetical protein